MGQTITVGGNLTERVPVSAGTLGAMTITFPGSGAQVGSNPGNQTIDGVPYQFRVFPASAALSVGAYNLPVEIELGGQTITTTLGLTVETSVYSVVNGALAAGLEPVFGFVEGDSDAVTISLYDSAGEAWQLPAGADVVFSLGRQGYAAIISRAAATVVTQGDGTADPPTPAVVSYAWPEGDGPLADYYVAEFEVTTTAGVRTTFPGTDLYGVRRYIRVNIGAEIA